MPFTSATVTWNTRGSMRILGKIIGILLLYFPWVTRCLDNANNFKKLSGIPAFPRYPQKYFVFLLLSLIVCAYKLNKQAAPVR
jgi:hypothetical protein